MDKMKRWGNIPLGLGLLLLAACASGARPAAVFKSRAEGREPRLVVEIGPARDGVSQLRMSGGALQSAVISGEARSEGELWRIDLMKLDWFDNWPNGWAQASFLLDGSASLQPSTSGWILKTDKAPQLDMVESASIRYFNTYVRENKGKIEFSHRWDRIQVVAKEILTRFSGSDLVKDPRILRRFLFPEIYGYDSPPVPDHAKVKAQGVAWNSDYTKELFPESLRTLRDSGTLLRDYKESPGLWLLDLAWKDFWEQKDKPIALEKE
jgi:hypothetical protein